MCGHQFLVYGSLLLWIVSIFEIMWSTLLFIFFGDMLMICGGVLITSFVFLSGIVMLPTNLFILHRLSNGKQLNQNSTLLCCPLWMCFLWVIVLNIFGAMLCTQKLLSCSGDPYSMIVNAMKEYRTVPRAKRFMDNLQLNLKCCGKDSYDDWFHYDWYDRLQDYTWESPHAMAPQLLVDDSVPVSCCKSGFCIANYLTELGTDTIHTRGCGNSAYNLIIISTRLYLFIFVITALIEICIFRLICDSDNRECDMSMGDVEQIMSVHSDFNTSSTTDQTVLFGTDRLDSSTGNESGKEKVKKHKSKKSRLFLKRSRESDIHS